MALEVKWLSDAKKEGLDYYRDAEALFAQIKVVDSPDVRKILRLIEKGEYFSPHFFIDRFGCKVSILDLSTGCKIALIVLLGKWDKWISLLEVGTDASYVILSVCKDNKILLRNEITSFVDYTEGNPVDIICCGEHSTTFDDFTLSVLYSWRG